ncbi:hypothetical protein K438DRAFT_1936056 [Mycena galopus ATCC 62051]|nr:hypothetical protein K438DRAFT_1936056 [Mycena galopus ATCC 62051]
MSGLRPTHLAVVFLLHCFLLALSANAAPLFNRQSTNGQPQTLMTTTYTQTPAGNMTQTCVITLTPVTAADGTAAVQEVKTCTLALGDANNSGTTTTSNGTASTGTDSSSSSTTDSTNSTSSSTDTAGTSSSTTAAAGSGGAVSVDGGVSEVSASATATASATDTSDSAASASATSTASADGSNEVAAGAPAVSAGGVSLVSVTATSASSAAATIAAAAEQAPSASTSAFVVPGQSIQVLPIGLGIFGAISGIALIVVLYLTYKRRAYRKAFRARKLAEEGAGMGYGGMAQR